jgi:hypothetical protein
MATEKIDPLFLLVKSLSKSEKRQFKVYAGRLGGNANANFMKLFNLLDKSTQFNEAQILKKTTIKKQQISNAKAHLYKLILKSLRLNPVHQNIRTHIREQFDFAAILYSKGLYNQSLKILEKAKEIAILNSENNLAFEIVEFEKVIESQYITRSLSNRAELLSKQAKELNLKNTRSSKLSNLALQLYSLLLKQGYVKNKDDVLYVTNYFKKRLPSYKISELSFKEKLFLYKAYLWYHLILQDFVNSYKFSQKWVDLFDDKPSMKIQNPVFYLKGINYLLESLYLIKHKAKFIEIFNKLEYEIDNELIALSENTKSLVFLYYNQNKLNQYFLEGKFTKGLPFVSFLINEIPKYHAIMDAHHVMVFYYKIASLYFGAGDYKTCIFYLNKIISNNELKMREDLLCFSRILNLVAHYDAGMDFNIEALIVSTYRFLLKMNDLQQVQRKMISFLKKLGKIYPQDLKQAFIELHEELKILENHPYEKRAFLYLDIISWLESKIENKTVEQIIRKKAKFLIKY